MLAKVLQRALRAPAGSRPCAGVRRGPEAAGPTELPNGLRVATEAHESHLACVSLFARVGSRFENHDTNGISHFIEHMAFRGFTSMNGEAVARTLNHLGAKVDAFTTREYQVFSAVCPSDRASDAVALLAKIVTELELSEEAMDCGRHSIEREMRDVELDAKAVCFDYLHETAFQGTPLANRVIGPSRNVRGFGRDCARRFMRGHYGPTRLLLTAAGALDQAAVADAAWRCFASSGGEERADGGPRRFTASQVRYRDDAMPFAHVALAFEAPGRSSEHYLPLLVAKNHVGGWHRSQGGGRRHASAAVRAAASAASCERLESFYVAYGDVGLWGVYLVVPNLDIENVIHNVQSMWMQLCFAATENDVQRAVNSTKLELARRVDGVVNCALDIGVQIMAKSERTPLAVLCRDLARVDATRLRAVAEAHVYDKPLAVAAVGPTEELPDYNRLQAGQYWLRL